MDNGALAGHLLLLEQQLLERTTVFRADFVEFGSSGRIWGKQKALAAIVD